MIHLDVTALNDEREMGDASSGFSGRTPAQAQVMLSVAFGNADAVERTVWYQNKNLRANRHFHNDHFYIFATCMHTMTTSHSLISMTQFGNTTLSSAC